MIGGEFRFFAPKTLDEALRLVQTHGASGKVLAGGMSLLPMMTLGLLHPEAIISLNHVSGLDGVEDGEKCLRIGAMTRHDTVQRDPLVRRHAPLLAAAAASIGDVQVRNRGTLGGSLSHAEPAADYVCATTTLGARFRLQKDGAERWLEAAAFFRDVMTTALEPDELLTAIELPKQAQGSGTAHLRLRRVEGAFPIVVACALVAPGFASVRLGLGGVGAGPVVLELTGTLAGGATAAALDAVGERAFAAAGGAMSDLNGSGAYRREMARVYARRVVRAAALDMQAAKSEQRR